MSGRTINWSRLENVISENIYSLIPSVKLTVGRKVSLNPQRIHTGDVEVAVNIVSQYFETLSKSFYIDVSSEIITNKDSLLRRGDRELFISSLGVINRGLFGKVDLTRNNNNVQFTTYTLLGVQLDLYRELNGTQSTMATLHDLGVLTDAFFIKRTFDKNITIEYCRESHNNVTKWYEENFELDIPMLRAMLNTAKSDAINIIRNTKTKVHNRPNERELGYGKIN